jgi:hypothetical protein
MKVVSEPLEALISNPSAAKKMTVGMEHIECWGNTEEQQ